MEKILLAVDNSKQSEKATKKAGELAVALESEITILTVVDADNIYHPVHSRFKKERLVEKREEEIKEKGEKILNKTEKLLEDFLEEKNIKINKLSKIGTPAEYICKIAGNNDYDLVIMASTGEGGVKRFLLGSTSDRVVRHAGTSVMIVK